MTSPFRFYRVSGVSMAPALRHGQFVVCWRWFKPRVGDIVVARVGHLVIKRVVRLEADHVWLEGDNKPASTDSREFGLIPQAALVAKVITP